MIALWVVYAAAVAALAGAAAWAVERVLRAWGRPSRHVWAASGHGARAGSIFRAREHAPAPDRDAAAAPLIVVDAVITTRRPTKREGSTPRRSRSSPARRLASSSATEPPAA